MDKPPGFHHPQHPHYICQLRISLYDLKQATREWYQKLTRQLFDLGFQGSKTDTSLYCTTTIPLYILIYVDDILVIGPSSSQIDNLVTSLKSHFRLKDLGHASHFLGIELQKHRDGFTLTQTQYTLSILHMLKMEHCKLLRSPTTCLTIRSRILDNSHLYRRIVGALQYLNFTRPDISYAVNQACRSMHSPKVADWARLKHLLQYLKGTVTHGLFFSHNSPVLLTSFSDADWAGDSCDRRSTSGFLLSWLQPRIMEFQETAYCGSIKHRSRV